MSHQWLKELAARFEAEVAAGIHPAPFIVPPGYFEEEQRMRKACNMLTNRPDFTVIIDDPMKPEQVDDSNRERLINELMGTIKHPPVPGANSQVITQRFQEWCDSVKLVPVARGNTVHTTDPLVIPVFQGDTARAVAERVMQRAKNQGLIPEESQLGNVDIADACAEALSLAGVYDHVSPRFVDEDGVDYPEETPIHLTRAIKETNEAVSAAREHTERLQRHADAFELTARAQGSKLARIADVFGNPAFGTFFKEPQNALETIRAILIERSEPVVNREWTNVLPAPNGKLTLGEFRQWSQCLPDETPLECDGFEADGAAFLDGAITLFQR